MADYWKSQAKKFCDFCKCWIADNKPSIGYHESGKRHKENVAKRISEISKNSAKSYKESVQVDLDMKKMEEEALKAYMKDLQDNPDYTSQRILEETEKKKKELEESVRRQKDGVEEAEPVKSEVLESVAETSSTKLWHEAKSDEGYTYYWNTVTSESVWEPPPEGFLSLEDQEKLKKEAKIKEELKKRKREEKAKKKEEMKALREGNKKKRKKEDDNDVAGAVMGPQPKVDLLGPWTVVKPKVEEPLDLELPQQEFVAIKVPELQESEVKFKEKTIATLETDVSKYHGFVKKEPQEYSESFKKRKVNRGNVRQKLDTY